MVESKTTNPWAVLGIAEGANDEEIRRAYMRRIKEHPPDRDPEAFERIRDAYNELKDPFDRFLKMLESVRPHEPLTRGSDEDEVSPGRSFVGPELWLAALREELGGE